MYKKTITYTDFNGVDRTEDFYFDLMQSELVELELGNSMKMSDFLTSIVNAQDVPSIMKVFKNMILMSYGEKSEDGRVFMKSPEIRERFSRTRAFDKFYMSFFDADENASARNMADFVNGIMPKEISDELSKRMDAQLTTNALA